MLYVFSDESGDVYDENQPYYVRSFVFVQEEVYERIEKKFEDIKRESSIKDEINFAHFKNIPERFASIFEEDFEVYLCFTDVLNQFPAREDRGEHRIIKDMEDFLREKRLKQYKLTHIKKERLHQKLKDAIRSVLWLAFFEEHCYMNCKKILQEILYGRDEYDILIDKPKFTERQYSDMLKELDIRHKLVDSKEHYGIQLADICAGSLNDVLRNRKNANYYKNYTFKKLYDRKNIKDPQYCFNPCRIFKGTKEEIEEYNEMLGKTWYFTPKTS